MKKIFSMFFILSIFLLFDNVQACPYQSMAEIDKKLQKPNKDMSTEKILRISKLRFEGEKILKSGDLKESEKILNDALALFK